MQREIMGKTRGFSVELHTYKVCDDFDHALPVRVQCALGIKFNWENLPFKLKQFKWKEVVLRGTT